MQTKTIATPCGNVIGEITPYGLRFRGIKYATAGRFEMPAEVRSFGGDFDATKQGVCCPQMRAFWNEEHRFYYQEFRKGKEFTYSEDCLILDVHAPDNAKNCPVIVFIHGGSFTGGSINEMQFNGSAYTKRGVIFIAINYRLNVFGFLPMVCIAKAISDCTINTPLSSGSDTTSVLSAAIPTTLLLWGKAQAR